MSNINQMVSDEQRLIQQLKQMFTVPCSGCTQCCHNDAVRLLPQDDASQYQVEPHRVFVGELQLAHKPNGDCVYLGEQGCTIHETKPLMCREMDCRNIAKAITYTQARKLHKTGRIHIQIWRRGKDLLRAAH